VDSGGWLTPLTSWPATVCAWLARDAWPVVRVVVAEVRGSAPREPGACMLVSASGSAGTIGGGHLEWRACAEARALLADPDPRPPVRLSHLVLGPALGQCCGGAVRLWLERFTPADLPLLTTAAQRLAAGEPVLILTEAEGGAVTRRLLPWRPGHRMRVNPDAPVRLLEPLAPAAPLWLYGAGHVGQALLRILTGLPFAITWIDTRADLFPQPLPPQVRTLAPAHPLDTVEQTPAAARILVMTHDHALDYALCRALLPRPFAWLGLIGSKSKAARFRSRLARDGLTPAQITRLTCPIGMTAIGSKLPAAIAVGIAARLLSEGGREADAPLLAGPTQAEPTLSGERPHNTGPCGAPGCAACTPPRSSNRNPHPDA
jgi:xanthine dehydrogenase accessory factor